MLCETLTQKVRTSTFGTGISTALAACDVCKAGLMVVAYRSDHVCMCAVLSTISVLLGA